MRQLIGGDGQDGRCGIERIQAQRRAELFLKRAAAIFSIGAPAATPIRMGCRCGKMAQRASLRPNPYSTARISERDKLWLKNSD